MSQAANCRQRLATRLSGRIFIAVKVLLLIVCLLEAFVYLWENGTKFRQVTKSESEAQGSGSHPVEITPSTSVFLLRRLGVAEVLLGVMLVGCALRRWPQLLDPKPPKIPSQDFHDDFTPDHSPLVHFLDVFHSSENCNVDVEKTVSFDSQVNTPDSSLLALSTCALRPGNSVRFNVSLSPPSRTAAHSRSHLNKTEHFAQISSTKRTVKAEVYEVSTHSNSWPNSGITNACKGTAMFGDISVKSRTSPKSVKLSESPLISSSVMTPWDDSVSLLHRTAGSDPLQFDGHSEPSAVSMSSQTLPSSVVCLPPEAPITSMSFPASKVFGSTNILGPAKISGLPEKKAEPSPKINVKYHAIRSYNRVPDPQWTAMPPFNAREAGIRLRKYQIKADQLRHKTESKYKMLGALCVRRNILTSDLVAIVHLVQTSRQQLDNQRIANKALMKCIDHVTATENGDGSSETNSASQITSDGSEAGSSYSSSVSSNSNNTRQHKELQQHQY